MPDNNKLTWINERRKLGILIPWEHNPRQIMKNQAKRLVESLEEFGQIQTIAITPDNMIIDGHQREKVWAAAEQYGADYEVDVRVASRILTEKERQKLTVFLHQGTIGEWNWDALANNFEFDNLIDWGFDEKQLLGLDFGDEKPEDPGAQMDRAEELRVKWGVEAGQLWEIGKHRLICGDCTDQAVVERVMGGERADIVFTDPPYGIEYKYHGYKDKREGYFVQMRKAFDLLDLQLSERATIYIKQYTSNLFDFQAIMPKRWRYKNLIVWKNISQARPKDNFNNAFEIIYEFDLGNEDLFVLIMLELGHPEFIKFAEKRHINWNGKERLEFPVLRGQMWNLWDDIKPLPGGFMRSKESFSEGSYKLHSCQMPAALPERALKFSSKENSILLDIFEGSGTTMVAAERLGRRCYGIEIVPAYCAVTLERMSGMGLIPILIE